MDLLAGGPETKGDAMKTANGLDLADDLRVRESGMGIWFYHLVRGGKTLCGDGPLLSGVFPVEGWGFHGDGHVPYKYCHRCEEIALAERTP